MDLDFFLSFMFLTLCIPTTHFNVSRASGCYKFGGQESAELVTICNRPAVLQSLKNTKLQYTLNLLKPNDIYIYIYFVPQR